MSRLRRARLWGLRLEMSGVMRSVFLGLTMMALTSIETWDAAFSSENAEEFMFRVLGSEFLRGEQLLFTMFMFSGIMYQLFFSQTQMRRDEQILLQPVGRLTLYGGRIFLAIIVSGVYIFYRIGVYWYASIVLQGEEILQLGVGFSVIYLVALLVSLGLTMLLSILPIDDLQKGALLVVMLPLIISPPVALFSPATTLVLFVLPAVVDILPDSAVSLLEMATQSTITSSLTPLIIVMVFVLLSMLLYAIVLSRTETQGRFT